MANSANRDFLESLKQGINEIREVNKDSAEIAKEAHILAKEAHIIAKEAHILGKETKALLKELGQNIGGYTKNEADSIEYEVNAKIAKYLVRKYSNHNVFELDWKILQKNTIAAMQNRDERVITDFDGLFLISNDPTYDTDTLISDLKSNLSGTENQFVVVEAKHDIDQRKVDKKIKQMVEFQKYINDAKAFSQFVHTQEFKRKIDFYSLDKVEPNIHFIFASPHIPKTCVDYIRSRAESWKSQGINVAIMLPTGNRYGIAWAETQFTYEDIIDASGLRVGAGKKRKVSKTKR